MPAIVWTALAVFHLIVFSYFIVLNTYYLVMGVFAFRQLHRYTQRSDVMDLLELAGDEGIPPATLIVPAYNEEKTCLAATRSFLALNYPNYEVVLVNDGSHDATLHVLREAFDLELAPRFPTSEIATSEVRGVYQSRTCPHLWVIDKVNGGRSDAINTGINYCRTPLFCTTDADSLLEEDALLRVARPFVEDENTVASGGIIRIANGCNVRGGAIEEVRLPKSWLARFQVLEYLRSFLAGRVGWDALEIMFLISGAFGMFRREIVAEMGGLDINSIGEDLELTVRLHRYCRDRGLPYRVAFVPDPVAWTEAPDTFRLLGNQRDRWQRGLIETMVLHRHMLLNPRYGRIGMVAYPYFFFLEMLGPVIEMAGYLVFGVMLAFGLISLPFAITFLLIAVILGTILSIVSVGLEEISFRRYARFRDLMGLFVLALVENFGYRQLQTYYRCRGIFSYLRGKKGWGAMEHKGFGTSV